MTPGSAITPYCALRCPCRLSSIVSSGPVAHDMSFNPLYPGNPYILKIIRYVRWTIPSILHQTRKIPLVYKVVKKLTDKK